MDIYLRRLDRIVLVVDRRGRTGKVVNLVDLDIQRIGYIVSEEFKVRIAQQIDDVLLTARIKIVDAEYVMLIFEESFAQVRPEETGPSSDCTSYSKVHDFHPSTICEISEFQRKAVIPKSSGRAIISV